MSGRVVQVPACDRCTQGVMDSTNPHLLGTCECACHDHARSCGAPPVAELDYAEMLA